MTKLCLRATYTILLFKAGYPFQVITLRSAHRDPRSTVANGNTARVTRRQIKDNTFGITSALYKSELKKKRETDQANAEP